jgi:hypothetical protein
MLLLKSIDKDEESIIMSSFAHFWSQVEKGYSKFEIIINLYWEKGIAAEVSGEDRKKVRELVDSSIRGLKHDIHEAYGELLVELYLKRFLKKKQVHFDKVFDNLLDSSFDEHPDKLSNALLQRLTGLMYSVDMAFAELERILLASIEELAAGKRKPDIAYIADMKARIDRIWKSLKIKGEEEKIWLVRFSDSIRAL